MVNERMSNTRRCYNAPHNYLGRLVNKKKSKIVKSKAKIEYLLEHFGIDPAVHYIDYPEEEESEESSNSSLDPADEDIHVGDECGDSEAADNSDMNNSLLHDAAEDNYDKIGRRIPEV